MRLMKGMMELPSQWMMRLISSSLKGMSFLMKNLVSCIQLSFRRVMDVPLSYECISMVAS